jgi:hypothetical protein
MKAKLIVEGKEFEININHPELEKLLKPKKNTGYERLESTCPYWAADELGVVEHLGAAEEEEVIDQIYENAQYYSSETVAENNDRADRLMRQLRRFAVEHREKELQWNLQGSKKYKIYYSYSGKGLYIDFDVYFKYLGCPYFDTEETARLAAKTFHDELIWYFTEYKDSL